MAKFKSKIFQQIAKALKVASDKALMSIGDEGVTRLREEEAQSDVTGRLSDSFSWATKKASSGTGPNAEAGDEVPQPTEPYTMVVGTQTPYSGSLNYGTVNSFQYGVNGAPNSFAELLREIRTWLRIKIANGNFTINGDVKEHDLAYRIAKSIEENGTEAHPFWEESIKDIKQIAPDYLQSAIDEELAKIKDVETILKTGTA